MRSRSNKGRSPSNGQWEKRSKQPRAKSRALLVVQLASRALRKIDWLSLDQLGPGLKTADTGNPASA